MLNKFGLAVALIAAGTFAASAMAEAREYKSGKHAAKRIVMVNKTANLHKRDRRIRRKVVARRAEPSRRVMRRRIVRPAYRIHRRLVAPRFRRDFAPHRCVAIGRTRRGYGRRIPGIRGVAFGPRACRRAMRECRGELRFRKFTGRNPLARCVIARRT